MTFTAPMPDETESAGSRARLEWACSVLGDPTPAEEARARATRIVLDHVQRLEVMLENTKDMITVLDENGNIRFSNRAAGLMTGHSEAVNSTNATEFIHPEDLDLAGEVFDACVAEPGSTHSVEIRIRHADGSWHHVDAWAENCLDQPVGGVIVSMRDICERKEAELALRRANEAMRDFVAIASHDLRSPVAVVTGLARALVEDWSRLDDPGRLDLAEVVAGASERLGRLVENLLIASRLDAGVTAGRPRPMVLAPALQAAAARAGGEVGELGARSGGVELSVPPGLAAVVDPDHLDRIVTNFLHNALHHGSEPVTISARSAGDLVEIRVSDCGPGVPEEFRPRLFERFSRAETTVSRGTGLGLSIVRDLARAAGGDAWHEPVEPNGACFVVSLPAAPAAPAG